MNIKPLGDRVLVVPAPAEEKIGGIIIPDTAKEKPLHGTIKAVGQGTKDEEMVLKDGTMMTKPDGSPMTKQEAIATNILNLAMKGDVKAAQYIQNIQMRAKIMKKK